MIVHCIKNANIGIENLLLFLWTNALMKEFLILKHSNALKKTYSTVKVIRLNLLPRENSNFGHKIHKKRKFGLYYFHASESNRWLKNRASDSYCKVKMLEIIKSNRKLNVKSQLNKFKETNKIDSAILIKNREN